ncbi:MAG TPA: radical SAM protein [Methylomirabilota bacterium]|nr:radical SAM protein [Methylomirabilota bacterium]
MTLDEPAYPRESGKRDRWIVERRPRRNKVDSNRPNAFFTEREPDGRGDVVSQATILLTNRECPWRCLMCDLWRNTLTERLAAGRVPQQIDHALSRLPAARQVKLYNSGSFFDPGAIPVADHPSIAELVKSFERVVVECHPTLVNRRCVEFAGRLDGRLEVAMGLETAHPEILDRLNKRMTLEDFRRASAFLGAGELSLRVFILVKPPFITSEEEAIHWAGRSIDYAFDCGARVVTLIPTRPGNGALDTLARQGWFAPPRLATLEACLQYGLRLGRGLVLADLWDLERFRGCEDCFAGRKARLERMNLSQSIEGGIHCPRCSGGE